MKIRPVKYRIPSQIKDDFKSGGVSVYWFSRRNLARVETAQYQRLRQIAGSIGVTRLIVPKEILEVDLAKLADATLEGYVKNRALMAGRVLDLRKLAVTLKQPEKTPLKKMFSWISSLILKGLQIAYSVKVRLTKADLKVVQYYNSSGEKIVAIVDYPEGDLRSQETPWVIVPPAFSKRKETYFLLALYLKKNGFGVVRYDDSCSLGESDREIRDLTLTRSTQNILATIDFVSRVLKAKSIGLVPFSLSARPAIKAATLDRRVSFMLPIVGSPSVQTLLDRVYGEDLVGDYAAGMRKGDLNLLGYFIDSSNFLGDAREKGFSDLGSTRQDMASVRIPIIWYCGTEDPWIDSSEVDEVLRINPHGMLRELKIFENLTHRFREAEMAHQIFAQAVRDIAQLAHNRMIKEVVRPWTGEIVERAIRERQRIQQIITEEEKVRLWTNYLEGFGILKETDDYLAYLSDLAGELDFRPQERLLDAGCGNGYVIEYLLSKMVNDILQQRMEGSRQGEIVGVDIVPEALGRARAMIPKVKRKLRDLPEVNFLEHDVDAKRLPFEDWQFDKVVASLLLSYLRNPREVVRELCRVLRPGGKIVLTSLKPDADVSQIYFRFIEKLKAKYPGEEQRELLHRARDLLNQAVSWIEAKEEEGIFKYFPAGELRNLLRENGITDIRLIRSFGDQANIVVGIKTS